MTSALYTLGYEGLSIDSFIECLRVNRVQLVLDVRQLPLSRKRGFSKQAFAQSLKAAGIDYQHIPELGCPKPIRVQYRVDGNWKSYTAAFNRYLAAQKNAVAELAQLALRMSSCLICFEADFKFCHRSMVACAAEKIGAPNIVHLTAQANPVCQVRAVA